MVKIKVKREKNNQIKKEIKVLMGMLYIGIGILLLSLIVSAITDSLCWYILSTIFLLIIFSLESNRDVLINRIEIREFMEKIKKSRS